MYITLLYINFSIYRLYYIQNLLRKDLLYIDNIIYGF